MLFLFKNKWRQKFSCGQNYHHGPWLEGQTDVEVGIVFLIRYTLVMKTYLCTFFSKIWSSAAWISLFNGVAEVSGYAISTWRLTIYEGNSNPIMALTCFASMRCWSCLVFYTINYEVPWDSFRKGVPYKFPIWFCGFHRFCDQYVWW